MKQLLLTFTTMAAAFSASAQSQPAVNQYVSPAPIKVNQVGYYSQGEKIATIEPRARAKTFAIKDQAGRTVWKGKAVAIKKSPFADVTRQEIDFSTLTTPGTYILKASNYQQPITISAHPYKEALKAAIKAFYLQRSGMEIEKRYAGAYARPAAHMDTVVKIHPSAASAGRAAGDIISSPKGWYDAGDYNKYVVNSSFAIGMMLQSYALNKDYLNTIKVNIPNNTNAPDLLEEIMYNLEWMLTMQDPSDGGVYHKLTTPNFESFVMPQDCHQTRYVVQKSTPATLDFAATMAMAARAYSPFPQHTAFCQQARQAAERAYAWAVRNPARYYDQEDINSKYVPAINTGTYGDDKAEDEFFWAATELYLTTGEKAYLEQAKLFAPDKFTIPAWGDVAGLGILEWLNQELTGSPMAKDFDTSKLKQSLKKQCDDDIQSLSTSPFHSVFGNKASDFIWGSNSEKCAGRGIAQMYEYALSNHNPSYKEAARSAIDCLFGRNATGYCYLTGFGTRKVMHPHHRISAADGIGDPLPGLLAGGANAGKQDAASVPPYPSPSPDEAYQDNEGSYASNEIAINWNAYLVALLGWMH